MICVDEAIRRLETADSLTHGDVLDPALSIEEPERASQYFDAIVRFYERAWGYSPDKALRVARNNLAYYANYGDKEQFERISKLYLNPIRERLLEAIENMEQRGESLE